MVRDSKDIRIFKFGVVLGISLGGIIYTVLRTRKIKPSNSSPRSCSTGGANGEVTKDDHASQTSESPTSRKSVSTVSEKHDLHVSKYIIENSTGVPPSCGIFNRGIETLMQYEHSPREYRIVEMVNHEQEIRSLKSIVKTLEERETSLEIQLLEYYGLKEQETAIMELRNQLRINNVEAKLFGLKIESLTADKMRLEAQVADYARVVAELEAAKAKIKQLKKKLRLEVDHSKGQILTLQEKVMKLHDKEKKSAEAEPDVQLKLRKLKDLENQAEELKKSNHSLRLENSELAQRLESVQILAASVLEDEQTEALKEETVQLRKKNEELVKEVEQLQADRCNDAEQLVYLRWINACLRFELRNYQPVAGKTIARDLSKTLSPKSEEKAKQLILEYANKESQGGREINVTDFDSDWQSSRTSSLTDSGEFDDTSIDSSSSHKTQTPGKKKVFGKLMKLLRGKDRPLSRTSSLETDQSVEDNVARHSSYSPGYSSGLDVRSRTSLQGSSKQFIIDSARNSVGGSSSGSGRLDYMSSSLTDSPQENQNKDGPEKVQKTDLIKYAEVLKGSRSKAGFCRRSASVSAF